MKRDYLVPQIEVVQVEIESAILSTSDLGTVKSLDFTSGQSF